MKKFFIHHAVWIIIGAVAIISVVGAFSYLDSNRAPSFTTTMATRGNVIASLDEPGTVAADNNASLSFQASGQIARVYVTEGEQVGAGAPLADLSTASLQAAVQQADAALAAAQAKLDGLKTGTRPEQLAIDQAAVASAQSALAVDIVNAYTAADDAIHNQTDNLFSNPKTNAPVFLVPMTNSQGMINIQTSRITIESTLAAWYAALNATSSSPSAPLATLANGSLSQVQSYLNAIALAVNDAIPNSTMTPTILAGYKVNVSTARTEVGAVVTTLTGAESALTAAQNTLTLAQAGSTPQDLEAQQASVAQAQAAGAAAQVALSNASLVAPFAGTVQDLTAQAGQVVSPGAPILALVGNGGLKIEAYASEADVAKIKTGETAQVMLDAFGTGTAFPATVTTIDAAETSVNGTPAYLVTLHFTESQPQVRDGMTGNVRIILAEHDNIVEVPSSLVINNNGSYFVLVQASSGPQQRAVQVGLVGDNGMTEIVSGVQEGDHLAEF